MFRYIRALYGFVIYKIALFKQKRNDYHGRQKDGKNSMIIMFHHVRDDDEPSISDSCRCTIKEFCDFLDFVQKKKQIVSLSDLIDNVNKGQNNMISITFDDVPDNFYTNAYPLLKSRGLPFTLYISIGLMDKPGFLKSSQIFELSQDSLCIIGGHTVNHIMLKNKNVNLELEICNSKKILEKLIGKPVVHMAYPYGTPSAINSKVFDYVKNSGLYRTATIAIPGFINKYSLRKSYALPRIHSRLFMRKYKQF